MTRLLPWLTHAVLLVACAVVLLPVLWVVKMALSDQAGLALDPSPLPTQISFGNFQRFVAGDPSPIPGVPVFWLQLGNSLLVSGAAAIIGVVFATTAAFAFSRYRFVGQSSLLRLLLLTQMYPAVVTAVPLFAILHALGLFGTLPGLILVYSTASVPFSIWMLKGYFDAIPAELHDAAVLDGAGPWTVFYSIMLPLVRPGIAITALFAFLSAWNEFVLAAIFLRRQDFLTLPVVLQQAAGTATYADWGLFAAGSLIVSVPVVGVFFLLQRHLIRGLTAGSVKG